MRKTPLPDATSKKMLLSRETLRFLGEAVAAAPTLGTLCCVAPTKSGISACQHE